MADMVRKVVIPAAGLGTRFLPITKAQPKEMLPVVDKPVIQYVVEEAVASGIDDIIIITGRNKRAIEDHFDRCIELEDKFSSNPGFTSHTYVDITDIPNIHYIRQREPKGLGDAILLTEKHCNDEPFVVLLGDTITIPPKGELTCTLQMIQAYNKYERSIIAIEPVPDYKIPDYGIIDGKKIEKDHYLIENIIEKPSIEDAPSNLGAIGCYLFTSEIFPRLRQTKPGKGGEIQLTDAIRTLSGSIGLVTNCQRYDIGDKLGWMKAFFELALQRDEFRDELIAILHENVCTE
ncbi:UTP--glucose-1-phosphate uridylyltransferase GalU [Methanospirillum sp.]|uniref:UTP--glucose-1-phosphate uridylyltransferase GalU n=1 Tax=Methanospirillum sp. TaxID=45200 RepID=UPI0035A13D4D